MKFKMKILALIMAFVFATAGVAVALTPYEDAYISGNWTFENDVQVWGNLITGGSILFNGVVYTWPAADGTATYQLTTDGAGTLSWAASGGIATDFALTADADAGDFDIKSIDGLYGIDDQVYIDLGTDAMVSIVSDGGITIDCSEFDVSGTTGAITINDDGDAGSVTIEGTVLDINSLDFVGAGAITAAASSAITINPNAGNAAGEDLIVTAHNVQLTAAGKLTMSPDAAETLAIDITSANYTNALSVGDNAIVGTTGLIDYTNFDVNADGDVTCVDLTASGAVNVGIWKQDAIVPASAPNHTLAVDGAGSGGVTIGATSTGNVTLGDDVVVSDTYDVLIGEGKLTIDDDANETALVITSDVTDGTSASITSTLTTGKGLSIIADSLAGGTALYLDATEGAGLTGYYILAYDGTANDFAVKRHGEVEITGAAGDMLTITTGDIEMTAGDIDVNDGVIEINTDEDQDSYIERAQATVTTPVLALVEQTDTGASSKAVLFIDQDTDSTPSSAIEIDTEGAYVMKVDALIAAGDGIYVDVADSYTGQWFIADAGPWLGTTGEGFWSFTTDGVGTNEVGQVIRVNLQGTGTAGTAVEGKAFHAESQAAVKAGESLVYLDTLTNTAIHIDNEGTAADGIKFDVANAYTGQGIVADLGPWLGTAGEGFINIETDSVGTAEAGMAIRINFQGTAADAAAISGKGIYVKDTAGATASSYLAHFESTNNGALYTKGDIDISNSWLVGASPIVLEGATDNAYELTIAVEDPTTDKTITLPDSPVNGDVPVVIGQGSTQTSQAGAGTSDVTGSSVTLPDGYFTAGKSIKWTIAGTITGANAAKNVIVYLDDAAAMTLATAAGTVGDYVAEFIVHEHTDTANQDIVGKFFSSAETVVDYATDTENMVGAAQTFKLQIVSGNAGDTITCEYVLVEFMN